MEFASRNEFILYALLINGAVGVVLGLVPLIAGVKKGNARLGVLGLAASTVGGLILGLVLALPAAAIFTWLIFRRKSDGPADPQ